MIITVINIIIIIIIVIIIIIIIIVIIIIMCSNHSFLQPPGLNWEARSSNGWAEYIWKTTHAVVELQWSNKNRCVLLNKSYKWIS